MDEVREGVISPMTTWLRGAPERGCVMSALDDGAVAISLFEGTVYFSGPDGPPRIVCQITAPTAEEAMANALNALFGQQAEQA